MDRVHIKSMVGAREIRPHIGGFSEAAASPGPSAFLCLSLPRTGEPDEEEGTFRSSIRREFGDTAGVCGAAVSKSPSAWAQNGFGGELALVADSPLTPELSASVSGLSTRRR